MANADLARWLKKPLPQKAASVGTMYWRLKTALLYRVQFQKLGSGTVIRRPMLIANPHCISIGDRVSIRDGVRLEAVIDDHGRIPLLTIGSDTFIEQNVQIICHSRITIGREVAIAGACAIVDVNHPFRDPGSKGSVAQHIADEDSFVEIGDGAFIGYGAVILPNVRIGQRSVVGANAVVTRDVPDFSVAAGVPARVVEQFDIETNVWKKISPAPTLSL